MLMQIGQTIETNGLRFHRYDSSFHVTELMNAGKRGKKVREFCLNKWSINQTERDVLLNAACDISEVTTYDGALTAAKMTGIELTERTLRGIDVEPASGSENSEFGFSNESVSVSCSIRTFCVRDVKDIWNESTVIPSGHNGKSGPAKFHKWLRANLDAARTMTFNGISEKMSELGIKTHFYCAVD